MITPQEAYNKGLSDSEDSIIRVFRKLIDEDIDEQFNNPEMEKLKYDIFNKTSFVEYIPESNSVDYVCQQLDHLLRGELIAEQEEFEFVEGQNLRLQKYLNAVATQLKWMHGIANNPKSNVGKYAKKAIENSLSHIDFVK